MYRKLLVSAVLLCKCIVSYGQTAAIPESVTPIDYNQNVNNYNELLSRTSKHLEIISTAKLNRKGNAQQKIMSVDLNVLAPYKSDTV